jgi:hypothetical protein
VKAPKFFKIDQKLIDFGLCETGGVRKINVTIISLTERTLSLHIFSLERSWKRTEKVFDLPTTIRVSPFSKTEFVLSFGREWKQISMKRFSLSVRSKSAGLGSPAGAVSRSEDV